MDWIDDSEKEGDDEQKPDRFTALKIGLALLPILFFFGYLGKLDLGTNVYLCLCVNVLAVRFRWNLRNHLWFWSTIALVMALEFPVVLLVQWPHEWVPDVALLPIGIAGYLVAIGALQLAEKLFGGPSRTGED